MYLANDITKRWCICLKGDPVEIISARSKTAITVSEFDITNEKPVTSEIKVPVVVENKVFTTCKIKKSIPVKKTKVSQPTIFFRK